MDDKTRILMTVIRELRHTQSQLIRGGGWGSQAYTERDGRVLAHFAPWDEPKVGDLVIATTTPQPNDFMIGWVQEVRGHSHCLIRELGGTRTCDYSNEQFVPIRGIHPIDLWEADRRAFYERVLRAFRRFDDLVSWRGVKVDGLWHRFGGLEFVDDTWAEITVRPRYGMPENAVLYTLRLKWQPLPGEVAIMNAMVKAGYAQHKFETTDGAQRTGD